MSIVFTCVCTCWNAVVCILEVGFVVGGCWGNMILAVVLCVNANACVWVLCECVQLCLRFVCRCVCTSMRPCVCVQVCTCLCACAARVSPNHTSCPLSTQSTQIVTTFRAKSTGQLSFISAFMLFNGSLARVFTTIQETNDTLMLISFLVGFTLNAVIMLQFAIYWNAGKGEDDAKKKKE